ncbi:MAG: hypothetical protein Q8N05_20315 [Bacteroidota bacterium]|nr:hypothetical protein [Bacteroidota bacterium]
MKKLSSFLVVFLLCSFNNGRAQQLFFNHFSVNSGLSQGVNQCIYRDSKGFVWISSFDGLNRFDGVSCISFRSSIDKKNGLKGTLFLNILEDKNSNLWIGSNAGLNFYNRRLDQFQNFRIEGIGNGEQFYSPFYIDNRNNIWLQSGSDIFIFNADDKTFTLIEHFFPTGNLIVKHSPEELFQSLNEVFAVSNNLPTVWEGSVVDKKIDWHAIPLTIPASRITALLITGNHTIWIGANNGVYRYQNNQQLNYINRYANKEIKNISTLHLDQKGTLWVGTLQQGLFTIDTAIGTVSNEYVNSPYNSYALSGNQVQYIYSDEKGTLWVSIWGKGVDYTSVNKFRFNHYITKEEAVQAGVDNFIRSIVQVNDEFWCGTQAGGILILDKNKRIKQSIRKGLPLSIEYLYLDKNNRIWAATFDGLFLIEPLSRKITKLPINKVGFGTVSNQYNFISSLRNGSMLASTNGGLFIIDKVNNTYRIKQVKGIINMNQVFLTTYMDSLNQIYISRAFKGFTVYQFAGDSLHLIKEFPMEATIKCFNEHSDSSLWIGSTIGLIRYNKYKLQQEQLITTKEGLSNQYIYGLEADGFEPKLQISYY